MGYIFQSYFEADRKKQDFVIQVVFSLYSSYSILIRIVSVGVLEYKAQSLLYTTIG